MKRGLHNKSECTSSIREGEMNSSFYFFWNSQQYRFSSRKFQFHSLSFSFKNQSTSIAFQSSLLRTFSHFVGMFLLCPKQRLLIGPYCPIRSHCGQSCGPVVLSFVLSIASPFRLYVQVGVSGTGRCRRSPIGSIGKDEYE